MYTSIPISDFRFNLSRILQQNAIISKRNLLPAVLEAGSPDEGTYKLIFRQGPIFCSVSLFSVQRWCPCCCVQGEINSVGFFYFIKMTVPSGTSQGPHLTLRWRFVGRHKDSSYGTWLERGWPWPCTLTSWFRVTAVHKYFPGFLVSFIYSLLHAFMTESTM